MGQLYRAKAVFIFQVKILTVLGQDEILKINLLVVLHFVLLDLSSILLHLLSKCFRTKVNLLYIGVRIATCELCS